MKSEIVMKKDSALEDRKYPWLGTTPSGTVVLFYREKVGTVLHVGTILDWDVGQFHKHWDMKAFKEFKGQVILSND